MSGFVSPRMCLFVVRDRLVPYICLCGMQSSASVFASYAHAVCRCQSSTCVFAFLVWLQFTCVYQQWHAGYTLPIRERVLHVLIHTSRHTQCGAGRGGEPRRSRFWHPSLTCSVQDFLQDVATKRVPDSSASLFFPLPPLPPRLFVF